MHTDDAREQGFDSALRHALATPAAVPPGDCVDGETLAAWSEGSLPALQAESVELHLSSCPSCQALLAAFVRTTPVQAAAVPLWRRWQLQWLVPLATATGALVIWLSVPGRPPAAAAHVQVARDERAVPEFTVPTSQQPRSENQKELEAKRSSEAAAASSSAGLMKRPARVPASPSMVAVAPTVAPQQTAAAEDALAKSIQDKQKREADSRVAAVADAAPPADAALRARADAAGRVALEQRKADTAATPAAPPAVAERPAPLVATAPAAAPLAPAEPPPPAAAPAAAPAAGNRQGVAAGGLARAFGAASIDVTSPTAASRWRIAIGIGVNYFGKTALAGRLADIPASTTMLAGSSPQDDVCWMVGRAGAVYLTTDGTHFTRIAFPDVVDLVAVRATNAQTVTVTSSSGRTYRTTDAGKSWQ